MQWSGCAALQNNGRSSSRTGALAIVSWLDDGSRMNREVHVRFCESAGVRFPRATHLADNLANGRKIRLLTIVDNFSRECVALEVATGFNGSDVASVLSRVSGERGTPHFIRCDNGSEFVSKAVDQWAYWNKVELDFSRPGKPTDNAFCESFNGRVRQELLNASWFQTLADARAQVARWRTQYNHHRPHGSLANLTPAEFANTAPKYAS